MGIPLREGRAFTPSERKEAPVIIINETAAKTWWPGDHAVGKQLTLEVRPEGKMTVHVVGVAADVRTEATSRTRNPELYFPFELAPRTMLHFVVLVDDPARFSIASLAKAVASADPRIPVLSARPLSEIVAESVQEPRTYAVLMGAFAAVALIVALAGIYGILAYSVARRTREIGIRLALGAPHGGVWRLVVGEGLIITAVGVVTGAAIARVLSPMMAALLHEVRPSDPVVFAGIGALMMLVALVACAIPARRASRVDPIIALRLE
jgi:putative ABC transport system permease protein